MASGTDPAMTGLMPPPPGVVQDFGRTTSVQISFIAVFAVTFVLATVALAMRVYTRFFLVKSVGLDERAYFLPYLTLAYLFSTASCPPDGFMTMANREQHFFSARGV